MVDTVGIVTVTGAVIFAIIFLFHPEIRSVLEPKSGFKVTNAYITPSGRYFLKIRDYVTHETYENRWDEKPTDQVVIDAVKAVRMEAQKEIDESESFRAQFKGRRFPD